MLESLHKEKLKIKLENVLNLQKSLHQKNKDFGSFFSEELNLEEKIEGEIDIEI